MLKLINNDCMTVMEQMPDKSVTLTLTDIPYGEINRKTNGLRNLDKMQADNVTFALAPFIKHIVRLITGSIYIFCGTEQVSKLRSLLVKHGASTRLLIWEKTNPSPMNGAYLWLSGIECCVFGKFHGATFNAHCRNSVLRYPTCPGKLHPTQKPLPLIIDLLVTSSNRGDIVFDPCMGSGTTGVAALSKFRKFIGIEQNKEWFEKAEARLTALQK